MQRILMTEWRGKRAVCCAECRKKTTHVQSKTCNDGDEKYGMLQKVLLHSLNLERVFPAVGDSQIGNVPCSRTNLIHTACLHIGNFAHGGMDRLCSRPKEWGVFRIAHSRLTILKPDNVAPASAGDYSSTRFGCSIFHQNRIAIFSSLV